jgi:small GTP-binding protein
VFPLPSPKYLTILALYIKPLLFFFYSNGKTRIQQNRPVIHSTFVELAAHPTMLSKPFRVVMIGDSQTGKTSIASRLIGNEAGVFQPTVGASVIQNLELRPSQRGADPVFITLWDTAGQERFRSLGPMYYKGSAAAMAVFDLTNTESFDNLDTWIQTFRDVVDGGIVCLLGNKCDLEAERKVSDAQVHAYARETGFDYYVTSAITGDGITEAFTGLADKLIGLITHQLQPSKDVDLGRGGGNECC